MTRVLRAFFHAGGRNAEPSAGTNRHAPKCRHSVGDGLDTGDRGAAGAECLQHDEHGGAHQQAVAVVRAERLHTLEVGGALRERRRDISEDADADQDEHVDDEEVGGDREHLPGFLRAA